MLSPLSPCSLHLGTSGLALCIIKEIQHPQKHTKLPASKLGGPFPQGRIAPHELCHGIDPGEP